MSRASFLGWLAMQSVLAFYRVFKGNRSAVSRNAVSAGRESDRKSCSEFAVLGELDSVQRPSSPVPFEWFVGTASGDNQQRFRRKFDKFSENAFWRRLADTHINTWTLSISGALST